MATQVKAWYLMTTSHYLEQCWLNTNEVLGHLPECNFTENASDIYHRYKIENLQFKGTVPSAREVWLICLMGLSTAPHQHVIKFCNLQIYTFIDMKYEGTFFSISHTSLIRTITDTNGAISSKAHLDSAGRGPLCHYSISARDVPSLPAATASRHKSVALHMLYYDFDTWTEFANL